MSDFLQKGRQVRVNVYGAIYDGKISEVTDSVITLEEDCGSATLYKVLYRDNIAAIEMRIPK